MAVPMSEQRKSAVWPTSSCVTLRRSGAFSSPMLMSLRKFLTPDAASVLMAPALMALTRIPSGPSSAAR